MSKRTRTQFSLVYALAIFVGVWCNSPLRSAGQSSAPSHEGSPPPAQPAPPPGIAVFRISGVLVDAITGEPLGQARVSLTDTRNSTRHASMITPEDGRFALDAVPPGKYFLYAAKTGYIAAGFNQHGQFSTAIVTGPGLDTQNLAFRLTPSAGLHGRVLDESGEPVRNAKIALYSADDGDGLAQVIISNRTETDDQGAYEFASLNPGTFFVSATAKPWYAVHPVHVENSNSPAVVDPSLDVAYPTTFYNGATDSAGATPVRLNGGHKQQIDNHLAPAPALHLFFHAPAEGGNGFPMPQFARQDFNNTEFVDTNGWQSVAPGVFEINGIPPGRYAVQVVRAGENQMEHSEIDLRNAGQELDMSRLQATVAINVTVKFPGDQPLPEQMYLGFQGPRGDRPAFQQVEASGQAKFSNLKPGNYSVLAGSSSAEYSVSRIVRDGREWTGHDITISSQTAPDITVFLVRGMVSVEGFVKRNGKGFAGAMIVLVPKDPQSHQDLFRRDQSDSDGSFIVRGVIPGEYTIIALDDAWNLQWREPGLLSHYLNQGQTLTVGALMQRTITLPDPLEPQKR